MNTQNIYNNKDINTKINLDTNSNTKIKICGLTSPAEARYLNENHVDFAGMVLFFPKSKRNISIEQAKEIMAALDASIKRVAVVVSPTIEQVRQIEAAGFDYVQIHGEIPEPTSPKHAQKQNAINANFFVIMLSLYNIFTFLIPRNHKNATPSQKIYSSSGTKKHFCTTGAIFRTFAVSETFFLAVFLPALLF